LALHRQDPITLSDADRRLLQNIKPAAARAASPRGNPPSERYPGAVALPLNPGAALIAIVLLSLGLWAAIWGALASLASAVLG